MKRQKHALQEEGWCSHTEALRVNPRLPIGSAGLCTPSSSRSLTAEVIEVKCYTKLNESLADESYISRVEVLRIGLHAQIGLLDVFTQSRRRSFAVKVMEAQKENEAG